MASMRVWRAAAYLSPRGGLHCRENKACYNHKRRGAISLINKNMFIAKGKTDWSMITAVMAIAAAAGGGLVPYISDTIAQTHYLSY